MDRLLLGLSGLAGAAGVALAAAAAHTSPAIASPDPLLAPASLVLLSHAPALLALALGGSGRRLLTSAGLVIAVGLALFSGDLAARALAGHRLFPGAAPAGGTLLILAWLGIGLAALVGPRRS